MTPHPDTTTPQPDALKVEHLDVVYRVGRHERDQWRL